MSKIMMQMRRTLRIPTSSINLMVETTLGLLPASLWQSKIRKLKRRRAAAEFIHSYQIIDYLLIFFHPI